MNSIGYNIYSVLGQTAIDANVAATFFEGLLSFLSPCVLPLVPGYLSYISGISVNRLGDSDAKVASTSKVLKTTLMFVAGLTTSFIILFGIYNSLTGLLGDFKGIIQVVAGILIIVFGLHFLGVFRIGFLNMERRFHLQSKPAGLVGAYLLGAAFAFGWTPCVGPFLGAALTNASDNSSMFSGVAMMLIYSAGLGIPFVLAGLFFNRFVGFMARVKRHFRTIEIISGLLLIVVGFLLLTNQFSKISEIVAPLSPIKI